MRVRRPPAVLEPLQRRPAALALAAAAGGVPAHLVGGALRDAFIGSPGRDLDAAVERDGERIAREVARRTGARFVDLGRAHFGAYRLVRDDGILDIWDREGTSLEADLLRRDFTVNALALDLATPSLLDPGSGLADLEARLLRATTDASFRDDPLRVLRLPRFLVQLAGFEPVPETVELARRAAGGLAEVAAERIREELQRIWGRERSPSIVELLARLEVYPRLWHKGAGEGAAERLRRRLERARALRVHLPEAAAGTVDLRRLDWAASFRALAPEGAAGGGGLAAEALGRARRRGLLGRREAADVGRLLELAPPAGEAGARRFLATAGAAWPTAALFLAAMSAPERGADLLEALSELAAREGHRLIDPERLVTGEDVCRILRLEPGPEVGRVLEEMRAAQVEGRLTERRAALAWLRRRAGRDAAT